MKEHDKVCQWAKGNRGLIALRFLACLEPGNEDGRLGASGSGDPNGVDPASFQRSKHTLQAHLASTSCKHEKWLTYGITTSNE
jgi:hypothetical protein